MIDRLIFGTARLSGGAYARSSRTLLEDCLRAGLTRFDTAPSYGMGAAEGLLGEVANGLTNVAIHTKLGSLRPSHPALRGWAKRARNILPRGSGTIPSMPRPYSFPPAHYDYSPAGMSASLEESLRRLNRTHVDLLLTHEAEPGDIPAKSWNVLERAREAGRCLAIGFATSGPVKHQPRGITAQIAPQAADFLSGCTDLRIFHSVRNVAVSQLSTNPDLAAAITQELLRAGIDQEGDCAIYLGAAALLLRSWPNASVIVATTDRTRLKQILELAPKLDCRPT